MFPEQTAKMRSVLESFVACGSADGRLGRGMRQYAPSRANTALAVRARMLRSATNDQFST